MRGGRHIYELRSLQHDLNHSVTCEGKYGCIMDILDCFWALIEALVAPDVRFRPLILVI